LSRVKLTDKQKKKIIADYVDNNNYSETARINNISETSVRRIVKGNDGITEKVEQKKEENTQDMFKYIETKNEEKKKIIDLCFKALNDKLEKTDIFTNVKDIITVYGILIDKELKFKELEIKKQELNSNKKIDGRITIVNDLEKE
jgi:hypothetical protein